MNLYKLPNGIVLYSKKEIISELTNYKFCNYYSCVDGNEYEAILEDAVLIAKQYPGKSSFYKVQK
jgi:hypothetical protein